MTKKIMPEASRSITQIPIATYEIGINVYFSFALSPKVIKVYFIVLSTPTSGHSLLMVFWAWVLKYIAVSNSRKTPDELMIKATLTQKNSDLLRNTISCCFKISRKPAILKSIYNIQKKAAPGLLNIKKFTRKKIIEYDTISIAANRTTYLLMLYSSLSFA